MRRIGYEMTSQILLECHQNVHQRKQQTNKQITEEQKSKFRWNNSNEVTANEEDLKHAFMWGGKRSNTHTQKRIIPGDAVYLYVNMPRNAI